MGMQLFERFLWFLAGWTMIEGMLVMLCPSAMVRFAQYLFRRWGEAFASMDRKDLRALGLIEFSFGLLLCGYLVLAN